MPSNMVTAKCEIVGIRALFFHRFGEDAIPLERGEVTGVAGNDPWCWAKTTPITAEGQLYLLPTQVFASVRDGGGHISYKRKSLKFPITATLQVMDDIILVDRFLPQEAIAFVQSKGRIGDPLTVLTQDPTAPVLLDIRKGLNPSTKKAMVIYRVVASKGWHVSFSLQWDKTVVSTAQMQAAMIDAGNLEGLSNARKIGMGRYEIQSFQVSEN